MCRRFLTDGLFSVEYLSDGMTETLISSLSNLPNLNVKPRSSVFRYKGKDTDLQTIAKGVSANPKFDKLSSCQHHAQFQMTCGSRLKLCFHLRPRAPKAGVRVPQTVTS
jgi:hypothetical protein